MADTYLDPARWAGERTGRAREPESYRPRADSNVLTVAEAAAMLGISRSHAYELVARHEIPSYRLGRRILVPQRAVEDIRASAFVREDWRDRPTLARQDSARWPEDPF
jgi:excisionase family DNA binding protein